MRRHFFAQAILALAAIGLLSAGMRGAFRAGWWQGYQVGQAAEPDEQGALPDWGRRWAPRGGAFGYGRGLYLSHARFGGFRPFGLLRSLFTFGLLLFLFGLITKAFGFWAWRHRGGKNWHKAWSHGHPPHGPRGHWPHGHPHGPHGPMPPWCCADSESDDRESGEAEPGEEQVAKVKPDAGAAESAD